MDSFPVSVCRTIQISRCKIYQNEDFRGFNKSKREYFYGLKLTLRKKSKMKKPEDFEKSINLKKRSNIY